MQFQSGIVMLQPCRVTIKAKTSTNVRIRLGFRASRLLA